MGEVDQSPPSSSEVNGWCYTSPPHAPCWSPWSVHGQIYLHVPSTWQWRTLHSCESICKAKWLFYWAAFKSAMWDILPFKLVFLYLMGYQFWNPSIRNDIHVSGNITLMGTLQQIVCTGPLSIYRCQQSEVAPVQKEIKVLFTLEMFTRWESSGLVRLQLPHQFFSSEVSAFL
jgi:hypothetical protein